jgi:AcrR family transcriptional regulator
LIPAAVDCDGVDDATPESRAPAIVSLELSRYGVPVTTDTQRAPRGPYAKTRVRRAEIVDAAIRVFAARGYHGGSVREVSRELGMSLTAVTHHFASKGELLQAVLERTDQGHVAFDRSDGVMAWALAVAEYNLGRAELVRVLAIVAAEASAPEHPAHPYFVARYATLRDLVTELIVEDQQAGRVAAHLDPEALADGLIALWDGLQLQWLIDPGIDMVGRFRSILSALLPAGPATRGARS